MTQPYITRRDFLNGTQIAIGAALTAPLLSDCGVQSENYPFALPGNYYPPAKTGLRGSHDGSWEVMHELVQGGEWAVSAAEEAYDLVVVGAGISGLAAAWFYRRKNPNARILVLDNHDDFGGHAKRNEFSINGETRIGYGGTEAIDTPSAYSDESLDLLKSIGVRTEAFYDYFDQEFWDRHSLSKAIFFDKASFGEDKLVTGYGQRPWAEFAADMPVSEQARQDFIRVQTAEVDHLPGLSFDEKFEILSNTSYETFLRDYWQVSEEVINIYKRWGMSFWCVGIDEVPTTLIQDYDGGMPGVSHTLPRTGHRNNEPYIFHFPDGNASVARLIVRSFMPDALPGSTMEDSVTATLDYSRLDRKGNPVKIRLNSTAVNVVNTDDGMGIDVTYVRDGKAHKVRGKHAVLACYNMGIPYLCPQMPEAQKQALGYGVKVPLVYTKVLVPDWKEFAEIGTDFIYYTDGFFKQVEFAYPVSIGDYKGSMEPEDPMILHMCHVPWVPDMEGPGQWREGRNRILRTPFSEFEDHVKRQLNQGLGHVGFDADREIRAITVNRWPHGYAYSPDLMWEPMWKTEAEKPWVIGRQPFGNIHIANSDAGVAANTNCAITQAHRAVQEIVG